MVARWSRRTLVLQLRRTRCGTSILRGFDHISTATANCQHGAWAYYYTDFPIALIDQNGASLLQTGLAVGNVRRRCERVLLYVLRDQALLANS